jgi:hypothetical protein
MSQMDRRCFLTLMLGVSIAAIAAGRMPTVPLDVTYYYLPG